MSSLLYRELNHDQANAIMDYCEDNNIEYDIWNAGEVFMGVSKIVELGTDWEKIPKQLY